jgi:gas vesicle protein
MSDETVNKNAAAALVAGALLGSGIALLLAPQSGRQTRRKLLRLTETAADKAQALQRKWERSLEHFIEDTEERLQTGLTSGMEWSESKLNKLQKTLEDARKVIGNKPRRLSRVDGLPQHARGNG